MQEINSFDYDQEEDYGESFPLQGLKVSPAGEDEEGPGDDGEVEKTAEDDDENKDEGEEEAYKCILCVKAFKSYAQLAQHMTSKAHRKAEKDAAKGERGKKKGAPAFVKRGKQSNNDNDNVEY